MATQLIDNFSLLSPVPNFARDRILTLAELRSDSQEGNYPKGYIVYCEENDSYYSYTGEKSALYGYFKPLELGGSGGGVSGALGAVETGEEYSDFGYIPPIAPDASVEGEELMIEGEVAGDELVVSDGMVNEEVWELG